MYKRIIFLFLFNLVSFSSFSYFEFGSYAVFDEISNQRSFRFISIPDDECNEPYLFELKKELITKFDEGYGYRYELPDQIKEYILEVGPLGCVLFENKNLIHQTNCFHGNIKAKGNGRTSFFENGYLYFSASDNSDPRINSYKYVIGMSMPIISEENQVYKVNLPFELESQNFYLLARAGKVLGMEEYSCNSNELLFEGDTVFDYINFVHIDDVDFLISKKNLFKKSNIHYLKTPNQLKHLIKNGLNISCSSMSEQNIRLSFSEEENSLFFGQQDVCFGEHIKKGKHIFKIYNNKVLQFDFLQDRALKTDYQFYEPTTLNRLDHIVFVLGAPRSGTTLLNSLLCGDESYPTFPERPEFVEAMSSYGGARENPNEIFLMHGLENIEQVKNFFQRRLDKFILSLISDMEPKNNFVAKDPYLTLHSKYLKDIFGSKLRIVFIVRDMRDIVASWRKLKQGAEVIDINITIKEIIRFYKQVNSIEKIHGKDILFVKYEDIVKKDVRVFRLLDKFLGYKIQRESWQNMSLASMDRDPSMPELLYKNPKTITDSSIGNYKKDLTKNECLLVEKAFKKYLKKFKYPLSQSHNCSDHLAEVVLPNVVKQNVVVNDVINLEEIVQPLVLPAAIEQDVQIRHDVDGHSHFNKRPAAMEYFFCQIGLGFFYNYVRYLIEMNIFNYR